jgi:hypothetical protein
MQSAVRTKESKTSKTSTTATAAVMSSHQLRRAPSSAAPKRGADSTERDERLTLSGSTASSGSIGPAFGRDLD